MDKSIMGLSLTNANYDKAILVLKQTANYKSTCGHPSKLPIS